VELDKREQALLRDTDPKLELQSKFRFLKSRFLSPKHQKSDPAFMYTEHSTKSAYQGDFYVIGMNKPIMECVLIHTAITLLRQFGYKNLKVQINTHGDKTSANAFDLKLRHFIKKHKASFDKNLKQAILSNPRAVLTLIPHQHESLSDLPSTLEFLTEESRDYFKTVVEYLETVGIEYDIESRLIGDGEFATETIFSIVETRGDKSTELARGWSFHRVAKKGGFKKDIPGSFISIKTKIKKPIKTRTLKSETDYSLVQFGPVAKFKSFLVLDNFLEANIPIRHSLAIEKLGSQMDAAERDKTKILVLLGQKEALENSVIIREIESRHQQIVKIPELREYFKMV
jgi:histidyl-tRNA synthetase